MLNKMTNRRVNRTDEKEEKRVTIWLNMVQRYFSLNVFLPLSPNGEKRGPPFFV